MSKRDSFIHVRIPENCREQLERDAQQSGRSISDYVRWKLFQESGPEAELFSLPSVGQKGRHYIRTTVTEEQAKVLKERCAEAGIPVSEYVRRALFKEQVIVILEGREILRQLTGIGNNLNQLTMLAHQGRITAVHLDEVERIQKKIIKELRNIMKRG